ncbi:pilus assembly protein PilP [Rodentibacter rarus]|nr:pilus assembly protein PilP [Rodentibacter rarus]
MMSRHFLGLCCLFFCLNAVATDPFDRSQRQMGENKMNLPKVRKEKCVFNEPSFAVESAFEQLKLVGVVLYKNRSEALFLDAQQQLIVAKQGYRLGQEGYLIQQIGKNAVKLLRSKAGQCEQMEPLELRF